MGQLKVQQMKGRVGLKRIGDVVVKEDRPEIRGMVFMVTHLVNVEEVD